MFSLFDFNFAKKITSRKAATFCALSAMVLVLSVCASKPQFQPEVGGAGAKSMQGGVVYAIPPKSPLMYMKLVTVGVDKDGMLLVRMFFRRKGEPAGEYLDPKEQSLTLPDSTTPIYPAQVHASVAGKPLIRLAAAAKQTVELKFALPAGSHDYPYLMLKWKIHYKNGTTQRTIAENERFDFVSKPPPERGVGEAYGGLDFPYDVYGPFPEDWTQPDFLWW